MKTEEIIVISVGGSLIVPNKIDIDFLKNFRKLILEYIQKKFRFIIVCGGGKTARKYQEAVKKITKLTRDDLDWLGIHATRINAHLLRTIFRKIAYPKIVKNPLEKINWKEKILIASGWKPGFSTDYDAVLLAKNFQAKKIINLTNIDYIYDKDPKKFKSAKPIKEISWEEFRKLIPTKWDPGLNVPFDPVASKSAEDLGFEVVIINGKKLNNLDKYLKNKKFIGTRIK